MSQWQIFRKVDGADVADIEQFDDGIWAGPGEDGFSTELVIAEMKSRKASGYSYIGRSTQVGERTEVDIAPRADVIAAEIRAKVVDSKKTEIIAAIAEGETRPMADVEAEAAAHADEQAEAICSTARMITLKNMGLAE
ncbi:hypothetical protein [Mesorhizobium sp. M0520]|uniref:hypothetical protein n=1 Tax=Mesorhizobium sp. M0520 TaxID=2956957 RepID=UPI003339507B